VLSVGRAESSHAEKILLQSFPNPFNPVITLKYEIPEDESVDIEVVNLQGSVVVTLITGKQTQGVHRIEWDAKNFSSGVYFCRLTVGNFSRVQKLLLIR
jgi:flagellar hook assembly protein FlgD